MKTIWKTATESPKFKTQKEDFKTDVLIIGGGIAGILCAYKLHLKGVDYALIEKDKICSGVTAGTTAKITYLHGVIYSKLIKKYGSETAKHYLNAHFTATNGFKELCSNIDCDFKAEDLFIYSRDNFAKIESEYRALKQLGVEATLTTKSELPFKIEGAVGVSGQGQFNPLKMLYEISKDLNIYENTEATEIGETIVLTNRGKIEAKKIIVATHFPFIDKHGLFFLKMYQHRSYVLALEGVQNPQKMYVDENDKGMSFRNYNGLLILGGGGHRTGKKGGNWEELRAFAEKNYKGYKEVGYFATQDCITLDGMEYIGRYSKSTPNLYVATGFNKWGMSSAFLSAELLCDLVMSKENKYEPIFSPMRSIWHKELALNCAESLYNILTPTVPRCSHLGCALKYNKAEHSWDCSCHGSRFNEDGEILNNPATKKLDNLPRYKG